MYKFQNTKTNRALLIAAGFTIHDPHCTFNRKAWIIIGEGESNNKLYGVDRRSYDIISVEGYLNMFMQGE